MNVGFDLVPALIGRRVDAVVGAYWTHESIVLENQGHAVTILRMEQWGVPDYYELVLVTDEATLRGKPEVIARFLRALRQGYNDAASNPQAGVDILLKGTRAEVDEKIERPGAALLAPLWKTDTIPFGTQDAAKWESFTRWMQANGLLGSQVKAQDAFTNRFIRTSKSAEGLPMTFTEALRHTHHDLWQRMITHPFVLELGEGTLPVDTFRAYFLQDYVCA